MSLPPKLITTLYRVNKKGDVEAHRREIAAANLNSTANSTTSDPLNIPPTSHVLESKFSQFLGQYNIQIDPDMLDIYIFTIITVATIVITVTRSFLFFNVAMKASQNLHNSMFRGITRAAMYFFNTNPSGRILNRFSKDMGQIDEILPSVMIDVIQIFLSLFGIVVVIAVVNPLYLVPTLLLAIIFYYLRTFYLKTSRNVKRLEAISMKVKR